MCIFTIKKVKGIPLYMHKIFCYAKMRIFLVEFHSLLQNLGIILFLFFFFHTLAYSDEKVEKVSFSTSDGVILTGFFHQPSIPGGKFIILLHGLGSNKEEWNSLLKILADKGYGFLSYDARGHGESIFKKDGSRINYQYFGEPRAGSEWEKMPSDIEQAVIFLFKNKKIQKNRIGLIGASLGANVSLIYASRNKDIFITILLSPGINYAGLATKGVIKQFTSRPIIFASSANDIYSFQSSKILYNEISSNKTAFFITGSGGHGVQMFDGAIEYKLLEHIKLIK